MDKKHIITITGKPGTGKSSTAKALSERLGYGRYSSGDFMRQLALERGRDIAQNSAITMNDRTLDDIVDSRQREFGETKDNFVMDGRMGWFVIPYSFKVYLKTDSRVSAERVLNGEKNPQRQATENIGHTIDEYMENVAARMRSDEDRYLKFYGVTPFDEKHYDLVIDNTSMGFDQVVDMIIELYQKWLET